ncbi:hypothetical protein Dimus_031593 [Dionaea muscipula]
MLAAFLDYYNIPYKVVEVNPISKKEIKWFDYKKVPILTVDDIIAILSERIDLEKLTGTTNNADEEREWLRWVDNHLVDVLSPNIYPTTGEALESFDYITTHGGPKPNLPDLAIIGVLRPIRHLRSGKDMVNHMRIGEWYARKETAVGESSRIKE